MSYAIGIALGIVVVLFGRVVGFDRDRAFYPTVLIVVASYSVLFAVMSGSPRTIAAETGFALVFVAIAIVGFRASPWIVAAGLAGHGLFDTVHGYVVDNAGMPPWWPAFCMAIDVVMAGGMGWILRRPPSPSIGPDRPDRASGAHPMGA